MKKLTQGLDALLRQSLIWLMAIMTLVVTWQVTSRYVFNSPSSYTQELSTYLLIWISLLGTAYALRLRAHLGVDVLTRKLQGNARRFSNLAIYIAIIIFAIFVFIYGGIRLVYVTLHLNQLSAAFKVPIGYIYLVLPFSGLMIVYYSIYALMYPEDQLLDTSLSSHDAATESGKGAGE